MELEMAESLAVEHAAGIIPKLEPSQQDGTLLQPSQQFSSQQTDALEDQPPAPSSPFEALQNRLRDHPHDNTAWQDLVNIAEDSGDLAKITAAYDSLLKVYPNTVSRESYICFPPQSCCISSHLLFGFCPSCTFPQSQVHCILLLESSHMHKGIYSYLLNM